MNYSDETLMAFADGEFSPEQRAQIEAAARADAGLAQRIAAFGKLRQTLRDAYAPMLEEPIPEHLRALLETPVARAHPAERAQPITPAQPVAQAQPPGQPQSIRQPHPVAHPSEQSHPASRELPAASASGASVASLTAARDARAQRSARTWGAPQWTAIAASLVVGIGAGFLSWPMLHGPVASRGGMLVADAALSQALSQSLAAESDPSPLSPASAAAMRIGMSYRAKSGDLCRSFTTAQLAGIACHRGERWDLKLVAQNSAPPAQNSRPQGSPPATQNSAPNAQTQGEYRTAASTTPPLILEAIAADIEGEPFDAAQEQAARARGWHAR